MQPETAGTAAVYPLVSFSRRLSWPVRRAVYLLSGACLLRVLTLLRRSCALFVLTLTRLGVLYRAAFDFEGMPHSTRWY